MTLRRQRSVKIVATLGPASEDEKTIRRLVEAGADMFRLNMSHGTQEEHKARYDIIRNIEADYDRPIGILADLQGPKLRVGTFKNGEEELVPGVQFRLDLDPKTHGLKEIGRVEAVNYSKKGYTQVIVLLLREPAPPVLPATAASVPARP